MQDASTLPTTTRDRRQKIHVSDIAALLGQSTRGKTRLDVYRAAVGLELPIDGEDIQRGRKFEDIARDEWCKKTGLHAVASSKELVHHRMPFFVGNTDGQVVEDENPLELKCPRVAKFWRTRSDGLDVDYICQGQGYAMLGSWPLTHWGIFCADNMQTLAFKIEADKSLHPVIEDTVDRFWNEHVAPGKPPEAANFYDEENLVIDRIGAELKVIDTENFIEACRQLREAALIVDDGEFLFETQKQRILAMIASKHGKYADSAGHVRLNFYESRGKPRFDFDALNKSRPLALDAVVTWMRQRMHKSLDTPTVEQLATDCELDLDTFRSRGESFDVFRPTYPKKEN